MNIVCYNRYKVDIAVTDGTFEAAFILFDSVCQKLVGLSCSQLLKTQENNHERIPDVVNAFCGKTFVFKIKLSETDLKQGYETYRVLKIFPVNDELENDYKLQRLEEVSIFYFLF